MKPCYAFINNVRRQLPGISILMGAYYVSLNADTMQEDRRMDYLVRGEAEDVICPVIENAKRNTNKRSITITPILK